MDQEFADLIPVFVEEARDRVERLATLATQVESDPQVLIEAKRELHTLKGAGRMLQLGALAELCHATEEVLESHPPGLGPLLTRVVDHLAKMVEVVADGGEPAADTELLSLLASPAATPPEKRATKPREKPSKATSGTKRKTTPKKKAKAKKEAPKPAEGKAPSGPPHPESPIPTTPAPAPLEPVPGPAAEAATPAGNGKGDGKGTPAPPHSAAEIRVDATALDGVADRATQMRIMALASRQTGEQLHDLARLAEEGLHEPQPSQVLAVLASMLRRMAVDVDTSQRRLSRAAESQLETILSLQVQPLRGFLLSLARYARELARSLGREVEVDLSGEETRLDRRIARELEDAVLHLVRNAVDHGIESPEEREKIGKPRAGRIRLAALTSGSRVRLEIEDDGAGVDPKAVARQAIKVGLLDRGASSSLTPTEIYRFLFTPGFSTRRQVSEISGRGVGLDVVTTSVNRVGGEVFLGSTPGVGTRVTVEVPMARRGELILLVRLGQVRLALPSGAVRRAQRIGSDEIVERDGRQLARLEGRLIPFVPLARIYGEASAATQLLLEGEVSGQALAVTVDEVEGEEEVLVRPITRTVGTDRLLEGVALLASGEPVGVLSPLMLAKRDPLRSRRAVRERKAAKRVRVLLVDDSLVTREMERRLLEDAGFEVVAAGDAEEALSSLGEQTFDCLVTDIEMPGMDGFELTEHLRGIEHFAHLPIIVVSTRDRPEDRLHGLKAGADAYLTKQSLDAGELVDLVRRLGGR